MFLQNAFHEEFIAPSLSFPEYIRRLRAWCDKMEYVLDRQPHRHYLGHYSRYLAEFDLEKFDDVDIPGQYLAVSVVSQCRINKFIVD